MNKDSLKFYPEYCPRPGCHGRIMIIDDEPTCVACSRNPPRLSVLHPEIKNKNLTRADIQIKPIYNSRR